MLSSVGLKLLSLGSILESFQCDKQNRRIGCWIALRTSLSLSFFLSSNNCLNAFTSSIGINTKLYVLGSQTRRTSHQHSPHPPHHLQQTMYHKTLIAYHRPDLKPFESIYRTIHQNPELSRQEAQTASICAQHLKSLASFTVHSHIGGHGVVGKLCNGPGPTVCLRAELDALPHLETTGATYASTKVVVDESGTRTPVMHACGHDMHAATLLAAASLLHSAREAWSGTLIVLFQPAEEVAEGAKAMVADGLWDPAKYGLPIPDILISQHVHAIKAGLVALSGGPILTAVDSFEVRIFGKSGHISRADLCVDPVVTASHIVVRLQTIVTKEVRPEEFAVVACASFHGGTNANIVPDYVDLKISVRAYSPAVHERLIASVKRVVYAECEASGSLKVREPRFRSIMQAPPTINDRESAEMLRPALKRYFGEKLIPSDPFGASEDVSILATSCGAPYLHYMYGCVDPDVWDKAEEEGKLGDIPHNHSAFFLPEIQPTMRTGVDAFAVTSLTFFDKLRKS